MAKGTFGERLKRERELREVTVKEIASATRIAPKFLEALENEDWNKLPGGVFGRGFVRSIARYLGLSEENLLSDYDLARGETSVPAQKPEERIPSPPKWIPALAAVLLIAALVGVVFGGRYAWRQYVAHRNAKKASAIVRLPSSNADQDPLVNNSPAAPASASEKSLLLELSVAASATTHGKVAADGLAVERGRDVGGSARALEPVAVAAGPVIPARAILAALERSDAGPGRRDDDIARGTRNALLLVVADQLCDVDGRRRERRAART